MDFTQIAKDFAKNKFGVDLVFEDIEDEIDPLDDKVETELPDNGLDDDTQKIVDISNLLLQSFRYDPTDELRLYLKTEEFKLKKDHEKVAWVRNLLWDHPQKITEEVEDEVGEFEGSAIVLDEISQRDLLRLIIRALGSNPHSYTFTLDRLPVRADENNYVQVIDTIENSIF